MDIDLANQPLWWCEKRRSSFLIIAEVLEMAKEGVVKTQIMYDTNMSFPQLKNYLSLLLERNLLEASQTSIKTTYKTTEKGTQYLQQYRTIAELLNKEEATNSLDAHSLHLVKRGSRVIIMK